jgi:putative ABC transport system substrate-binding protein
MNKTTISVALVLMLFALSFPVDAQQPKKVPRIGYLSAGGNSPCSGRCEAFRQGLRELGYVEGKNIIAEYRFGEGKSDRPPALAAELVALKVDVIVTSGSTDTRAAKRATHTIPIVMTQDSDPVGNGFVASLARPEGNVTGLSNLSSEISGKRLELLKETVSRLSRVAVLGSRIEPGNAQAITETERAAGALAVKLQFLDVKKHKDIEVSFRAASKTQADAVLVLASPVIISQRKQMVDLAIKNRVPTMYYRGEFVEDGGLMSYAPNLIDLSRRAAVYVDKILKGAKPTELPVEQPIRVHHQPKNR